MTQKPDEHRRIVITERPETDHEIQPTTEARKRLYELIVRFRRRAAKSQDAATQHLFEFAAGVIARLIRLFKRHEKDTDTSNDDTQPSHDD